MALPYNLKLYDTMKEWDWDEAQSILNSESTNQTDLEYTDKTGCNMLHYACSDDATPFELLQSLLRFASTHALRSQRDNGFTPLHDAVENSSEEDMMMMLINACPDAASLQSNNGCTPLHLALQWKRSVKIIKRLLIAFPSAVMVPNRYGDTPLLQFFSKWELGLGDLLLSYDFRNESPSHILHMSLFDPWEEDNDTSCMEIYEIMMLLLRAIMCGTIEDEQPVDNDDSDDNDEFRPLHMMLQLDSCPWPFFNLVLKLHPDECWKTDRKGNVPLHIAAMSKGDDMDAKIIDLLSINPTAATSLNHERRLPLNLAIENHHFRKDMIEAILFTAPRTLQTRDVKTHLFPFMLAAVELDGRKKKLDGVRQVNVVYCLLRQDPSVILWGVLPKE